MNRSWAAGLGVGLIYLAVYLLVCALDAAIGSRRVDWDDSFPFIVLGWVFVSIGSATLFKVFIRN